MTELLGRAFYERNVVDVAKALLGCVIWSHVDGERVGFAVVETEAYNGPEDEASHAWRMKHGSVRALWGPPGIAYVYRSYGIHAMVNVVTQPEHSPSAVLLRAGRPVEGWEAIRARRPGVPDRDLARGPGRLARALGVSLSDDGIDVTTSDRLWLTGGDRPSKVLAGPRIGISRAVDRPWRFFVEGDPAVSSHRRGAVLDAW